AVGRVHGGYDYALIGQDLPARFHCCTAAFAGGVGKPFQELAVLAIAKIESRVPVVGAPKVGAGHYSLGLSRLEGEARGALRLDNGCYGGLTVHFDNG